MPRWWSVGITGIAIIAFETVAKSGAGWQIVAFAITHTVAYPAAGE